MAFAVLWTILAAFVNGGGKAGQRGGGKAGQWREDGPTAKLSQRLSGSDFASVGIDKLDGGLVLWAWSGVFPPARGLRQPITLTVHSQDVDVVGQPIEERTSQSLGTEHRGPFLERKVRCDDG